MKKTTDCEAERIATKKSPEQMTKTDANKMAQLFSEINSVIGQLEHRLDALLDEVARFGDNDVLVSRVVADAVRGELFDMFQNCTKLIVGYGEFDEPPEYDASGVSMRLEKLIKRRFANDLDLQKAGGKALESAFYAMDYPPQVIEPALIEGVTEDFHDLFELLIREETTTAGAKGAKRRRGVDEAPVRVKEYRRFLVEEYSSAIVVIDNTPGKRKKSYRFRLNSWAHKAALKLIKYYDAGKEQLCNSNGKWRGAFQKRRGGKAHDDAVRFYRDQVFKLPRWDSEKQQYMNNQYDGRWRLWTDDELLLPEHKRISDFKKSHPN